MSTKWVKIKWLALAGERENREQRALSSHTVSINLQDSFGKEIFESCIKVEGAHILWPKCPFLHICSTDTCGMYFFPHIPNNSLKLQTTQVSTIRKALTWIMAYSKSTTMKINPPAHGNLGETHMENIERKRLTWKSRGICLYELPHKKTLN